MRPPYLILLFFILPIFGYAKTPAYILDSLKRVLQNTSKPPISLYLQLSEAYLDVDNDLAYRYADLAYQAAKRAGKALDENLAKMAIGTALGHAGKNFECLSYLEEALRYGQSINHQTLKIGSASGLGSAHFLVGNRETALKYFIQILEMDVSPETLYRHNCNLHIWLSRTYSAQKNYPKALQYLEEEKAYFEKKKVFNPAIYSEIGNLHYAQKEYQKAYDLYKTAYDYELNRIAKSKHWHALGYLLNNMGLTKVKTKQYQEALTMYEKALLYFEKSKNERDYVNTLSNLAQLYYETADYTKAIQTAEKGYMQAKKMRDYGLLLEIANRLIQTYKAEKNNEKIYFYQNEKTAYQDTLLQFKQEKELLAISFQEQNAAKRKELHALEEYNTRLFFYTLFALGTIVTLVMVSFLTVRSNVLYRKYLQEEARKNELQAILIKEGKENAALQQEIWLEERTQNELKQQVNALNQARLKDKVDFQARQLASQSTMLIQKNDWLIEIEEKLKIQLNNLPTEQQTDLTRQFRHLFREIQQGLHIEDDWESYKQHFAQVHPLFFDKLQARFPKITNNDLRMCAYLKMNIPNREIAQMLNIGEPSLRVNLTRLKGKFDLGKEDDLRTFLSNLLF